MTCDIVIPVFNQVKFTKNCIESIKKCTYVDHRIIIINDASDDPQIVNFFNNLKSNNIRIINNETNLGWVKSVNRGLAESSTEYVCVMNNDTVVTDGWLGEMIKIAQGSPDIGLVNPQWKKPDRISIYDYAQRLKRFKDEFIETDWVRGFCFLIKREVLNKIQGFDETYSPGYYDDWDFSMRAIKVGFRCVRAKAAYVYHHRNVTHRDILKQEYLDNLMEKNKKLFYQRWGRPLRTVFAFSRPINNQVRMQKLLFQLAKEQHKIYIWTTKRNISIIEHTNVRMYLLPRFLFGLLFFLNVYNNLGRNPNKRYNTIFVNDKLVIDLLSFFRLNRITNIFFVDFDSESIQDEINIKVENIKKINTCCL